MRHRHVNRRIVTSSVSYDDDNDDGNDDDHDDGNDAGHAAIGLFGKFTSRAANPQLTCTCCETASHQ